jgi:hypothetical protein
VLGWLGFIGKLFQFCLEKVIGKKIDLAQDQRKRSATAFLRLYNSLQSLENLCATFLHIARPVVVGERKRLRNESFRVLSQEADRASEEFLASAKDLIGALQIFDPTLALMLGQVQHGKFTFLAASSGFEKILSPLDSRANHKGVLEQVTYTGPSADLEAIDFEGLYQTIEGCGDGPWQRDWHPELISGELVIKRVPTEWPKDSLLNLLEGRIVDHVLLPTDIEQIKALSDLTERHLAVLSELGSKWVLSSPRISPLKTYFTSAKSRGVESSEQNTVSF